MVVGRRYCDGYVFDWNHFYPHDRNVQIVIVVVVVCVVNHYFHVRDFLIADIYDDYDLPVIDDDNDSTNSEMKNLLMLAAAVVVVMMMLVDV